MQSRSIYSNIFFLYRVCLKPSVTPSVCCCGMSHSTLLASPSFLKALAATAATADYEHGDAKRSSSDSSSSSSSLLIGVGLPVLPCRVLNANDTERHMANHMVTRCYTVSSNAPSSAQPPPPPYFLLLFLLLVIHRSYASLTCTSSR